VCHLAMYILPTTEPLLLSAIGPMYLQKKFENDMEALSKPCTLSIR